VGTGHEQFINCIGDTLLDDLDALWSDALWDQVCRELPIAKDDPNSPEQAFIMNLAHDAHKVALSQRTPLHQYILVQCTPKASNMDGVSEVDIQAFTIHQFLSSKPGLLLGAPA
jgi:hypothetical protein